MTFKPTIDFPQTDDYRSLFLNNVPFLDVRAPVEFNQGAFPIAENISLMNDQERTILVYVIKIMGKMLLLNLAKN